MFPPLCTLESLIRRHAVGLSVGLAIALGGGIDVVAADAATDTAISAREQDRTPIRRNDAETQAARSRTGSMTGTLAILGMVLGSAYVVLLVARRRQSSRPASTSEAIDVLASRRLDGQSTLHLVRIGRRVLAIGSAAGSLRTLAVVDDPEEIASLMSSRDGSGTGSTGWFSAKDNSPSAPDVACSSTAAPRSVVVAERSGRAA